MPTWNKTGSYVLLPMQTMEKPMKPFVWMVALTLPLTGAVFGANATTATTKADCEKADGVWNDQSNECAQESAKMGKEEGTHEGANLGATPENDTKKIDQPERRNPTTSN
jgi:hypothetical protein